MVVRLGPSLVLAILILAGGCGGGSNGPATGGSGSAPAGNSAATLAGDPAAGKRLFTSERLKCGACHTFTDADTHGSDDDPPNGPHLDRLPAFAEQADRGSLVEFVRESIRNPTAYTQPGFPRGLMHRPQASDEEIEDLVAFLVANVGEPADGG
jgi:mono/diheme cytochrome c family protein